MASFENFVEYNKHQVILNSERLLFNSKEDSIFLIGNKHIALSANDSVHVNVGRINALDPEKNKFIVNAPTVQFGLPTVENKLEPITKGDTTAELLNDLISAISSFSKKLEKAVGTGSGTVSLNSINTAARDLSNAAKAASKKVENIKSKTSYTI